MEENRHVLSGNVFKEKEHLFYPFLPPTCRKAGGMAGAPAALLNHEGKATYRGRRGNREKGAGPPSSSLLPHDEEASISSERLLFLGSCRLQPKTDKVPEKRETNREKQRELGGRATGPDTDETHGNTRVTPSLARGTRPRTALCRRPLLSHLRRRPAAARAS